MTDKDNQAQVKYYASHNALGYFSATFPTLEQAQKYAKNETGLVPEWELVLVGKKIGTERLLPDFIYFDGHEYKLQIEEDPE
jgi:hypothetical protein